MVVVRPDQYVSHVLPLDAYAELAAFFDPLLIDVRRAVDPSSMSPELTAGATAGSA